jgi:glycosyltransferase involved in cell wall biosynthesis
MEKKKKILYHYLIGVPSGGSDQCLYSFLKLLDQSKYEPFLLFKKNSFFLDNLRNIGIKLIPLSKLSNSKENTSPQKKNKLFPISLEVLLKTISKVFWLINIINKYNIDIIHANHNLNGDRSVIIAAMILRKKIVSHYRGLYSPFFIDKFIHPYIDQIICISQFAKNEYVHYGILESKCKVIYDGIDVKKFKSSRLKSDNIIIGCIGRIEKWKGQQILVDAAKIILRKFAEIKFLIVGEGSNKISLIQKVSNEYLNDYFEFTGEVINIKDYVDMCSIIVHTSIEPEPFGMVIIESMGLEKAVIASNIGGPSEIITHDIDGMLIEPNNPLKLATAIIELCENQEKRKRLSSAARETVLKRFNVENSAIAIQNIYENLNE